MISKEQSHSEYYCCTVVTVVCTCETQMQHNSPHFLIQYSNNTGRFEVSSTCIYSSHGDTTEYTPRSLGVRLTVKYCYYYVKCESRILIICVKYMAQPMSKS